MDTNIIMGSGTASGTDTYAVTLSLNVTALRTFGIYLISFTNANTGAATLNINGIGAIALKKDGATALASGDISAGQVYELVYDGTNFQIPALSGGGGPSLRNVSATATFSTANETINCTANTFTVNLPTAVGIQGTTYTLVNSGTGTITLDPNGTETINGSLTIDVKRQYVSRTVQSDGTNWIII